MIRNILNYISIPRICYTYICIMLLKHKVINIINHSMLAIFILKYIDPLFCNPGTTNGFIFMLNWVDSQDSCLKSS